MCQVGATASDQTSHKAIRSLRIAAGNQGLGVLALGGAVQRRKGRLVRLSEIPPKRQGYSKDLARQYTVECFTLVGGDGKPAADLLRLAGK